MQVVEWDNKEIENQWGIKWYKNASQNYEIAQQMPKSPMGPYL